MGYFHDTACHDDFWIYPISLFLRIQVFSRRDFLRNVSAIQNNATLLESYNNGLKIDYSRAVVEWIIFVEVLAFFVTFIPDFHRIRVDVSITRPLDSPKGRDTGENELGVMKN